MKKSTKWILAVIGIVLALGMGAGVVLGTQVAPIVTAYAAKRLCSCVFVSHREPTAVLQEELKPYGYVHLDIDYGQKKVTGSILGVAKRTAVYREGLGCTLTIGVAEDELRSQAAGLKPARSGPSNKSWPEGDAVQDDPLPAVIDAQKLKNATDRAFAEPDPAKPRRTRAVIVLYDGRIIAERYAAGFTRETSQLGWSMTKSVTNALVGVLVKDGKLRLKDPAPVPEWRSPQDSRAAITLDELMRMSSGLRFKEDYKNPRSDAIRMLLAEPDAGAYAAEKPLEVPPNSRWSYSSGTANIISRIVRQSVGGSLSDFVAFAHRALFDRVGMASVVIEPDPSGTFVGSSFMYATPRDWARFGLLYYNDGVWKNERILPEGWVKYSTTPTPNAPKGEYGAQFWLNAGRSGEPEDRWMPKVPPDMYSLRGFEGQYVAIIPSKKLVIVRLGLSAADKAWDQEQFIADIIEALKG
jgi:CubicO group peptidase (beta-lactamase class C family)